MAGNKNSIQYFKSTFLKNGLHRPTKYEVTLMAPGQPGGPGAGMLNFQPEALNLPGRSHETIKDDLFFGPARSIPVARDFSGQIVMQFPVSDTQSERSFFEKWMDTVIDPEREFSKYNLNSETINGGTMTIETFDSKGGVSSTYDFKEVYPLTIMPVNLGYGMRDSYTQMQVAMEFRSYTYKSTGHSTADSSTGSPSPGSEPRQTNHTLWVT